jgi:hypothetical protein
MEAKDGVTIIYKIDKTEIKSSYKVRSFYASSATQLFRAFWQ